MALIIEHNIPITETRGRPPSEEHMALMTIPVGSSFVSPKRREALYQLARSLNVPVKILIEEEGEHAGQCRVWKTGHPGQRKRRRKKIEKG